jgi:mRNA interferase MazF
MVICDQWDVVAVPFPFIERPATRRRPALIVSGRRFNAGNDRSILAMVTTARHSAWPSDHRIDDLAAAGLPVVSVVRWKVFTLPNEIIERKLGALGANDRIAIGDAIRSIMPG